jgi:SP family galactose:H+ symporter-like MFS transporter
MYLIATVAALAGLLFGYDAGIISGAMLFIKNTFRMTDTELGILVSAVPFGALVAAALCGRLNDLLGRKIILIVTAILYLVGSILSAVSSSIDMLIFSRLLLGFAVGLGSYSAPMYIAEISQFNNRGALVTLNQLAITVGIMLSYIIDYIFAYHGQWRYMLGCGFIPALILFFCVLSLPESPRWLVTKGRVEKAKIILREIHGNSADAEFKQISDTVSQKAMSFTALLQSGFLRVLMLGILVSVLTQAVGINAIIYYAPEIFQTAGLTKATSSILATAGIGLINVIFTIVAVTLLDRFGRRKMLLTGVGGIMLSLMIVTTAFSFGVTSLSLAWGIIASFVLFVACQAIGTGPACWLIPSEIFPTEARGVGMGLSVAFNWGTNVIVAFGFPVVLNAIGASWTFGIFLVIAIIAFLVFSLLVPETKGVTLEQIERNIYAGKKLRDLGNS